jgi:hypothetical protein
MYEMLDEHGMDFVVRFSRACYEVGRDLKDLKYLEACIAYHYFAHDLDADLVKALHENDWHEYSIQTDPFLTADSVDANARAALRAIVPTPGFDYDAFIAEVKKEANAAVRRLYGDERKMTPTEGVKTAVG